jgi:hypothetical protein
MTKADLIKELEAFPDDAEIVYADSEFSHVNVRRVYMADNDTGWRNESSGKKVIVLDH